MKHNQLRSIAHNIADSLSSGIGLMIGVYSMDIFGEAKSAAEGFLLVDFLKGSVTGGPVSDSLRTAVEHYRDALPAFCRKHGASVANYRRLTAEYSAKGSVRVTIEDDHRRLSTDDYVGPALAHYRVVDSLGRVRTIRRRS